MPAVDVVISSAVSTSMRCRQVEALFDVPVEEKQTLTWRGDVPLEAREWNVGLITGPSGAGKTTVARKLFGDRIVPTFKWPGKSVLDSFPKKMSLEEIGAICQAVGFNTIPAWLRPFHVLSNGEQFRVTLARLLSELPDLAVMDEFTSVVDRQVAKIGSYAVQKYVRKRGTKFVAVSCHSDIVEWLNPDWILEPATMTFAWRELQRRPPLDVEISRVDYSAWRTFAPFHYMSAELHRAAQCYVLFVGGVPAVFGGMLYRPHAQAKDIWGLSRVVCLPDYQGLGLAFVLMEKLGAAFKACAQRMHCYPAHPSLIRSFDRATMWALERKPGFSHSNRQTQSETSRKLTGEFGGRPNAVFSYCGAAMSDVREARSFLGIPSLSRHT